MGSSPSIVTARGEETEDGMTEKADDVHGVSLDVGQARYAGEEEIVFVVYRAPLRGLTELAYGLPKTRAMTPHLSGQPL